MSEQLTLGLWLTSSPASADGPTPSASPDGPTTGPCGPHLCPASRSAPPDSGAESPTSAISGQSSASSSPSAALQSSLESRLRARLAGLGSPLYALTWKRWDMPSGPPICALRGRGLRISVSDCSGELSEWPTPTASGFAAKDIDRLMERRKAAAERHGNNGFGLTLDQLVAATAAGWATPAARDWKDGASVGTVEVNGLLGRQVWEAAGWATPTVADSRGTRRATSTGAATDWTLCDLVWTHGGPPAGSCAPTDELGRLHPSHAGWLMGYPPEWDSCGATAMPLSRR